LNIYRYRAFLFIIAACVYCAILAACIPPLSKEEYIEKVDPTLTLDKSTVSIHRYETVILKAIVTPSIEVELDWFTSDTSIVRGYSSSEDSCEISGQNPGTATILVASAELPDKSATCEVTVLP